jgi:hypothetical protein
LSFDLDSSVVPVFGGQQNAAVGYHPRYRGKRSYNPLRCIEANSSDLWDTALRPGNAGTWGGRFGISMTGALPWNRESANCARTSHCAKSQLPHSRRTRCSWK